MTQNRDSTHPRRTSLALRLPDLMVIAAVLVSLALVVASACAPTEDDFEAVDYESSSYDAGFESGREAGYESGYSEGYHDGYDEGVEDVVSCAWSYSLILYYGDDEYEAVPVDELEYSCP